MLLTHAATAWLQGLANTCGGSIPLQSKQLKQNFNEICKINIKRQTPLEKSQNFQIDSADKFPSSIFNIKLELGNAVKSFGGTFR